tara:strand:- start:25132 stop:25854 length:723 start_codon:yes stop_codon:yes gene_type:complete
VASARDNANGGSETMDRSELEQALGHRFANAKLLETALTHRSFANEHAAENCKDNETLEFLGDAVLDLVIGQHLMERFPALGEGDLSMTRAQMVSEHGLCEVARPLKLGAWLRLGRGEERSGGRDKASLLSDSLEAVIAAVYLDGGFDAAKTVVLAHFAPHTPATPGQRMDFKTKLQEHVQRVHKSTPVYERIAEEGPDHEKVFEVAVIVDGKELARGTGHSKKAAEQAAAALAMELLSP